MKKCGINWLPGDQHTEGVTCPNAADTSVILLGKERAKVCAYHAFKLEVNRQADSASEASGGDYLGNDPDPEVTAAGRARLLRAISSDETPAEARARAKGWSVNPGDLRVSGPLDELARSNNERARTPGLL